MQLHRQQIIELKQSFNEKIKKLKQKHHTNEYKLESSY